MATIPEALNLALQHHQAGCLQEAEAIYRQILQLQPDHPDALHLLGVIAHQVGRHGVAVGFISQAIERNPNVAEFHNNIGEAYRALGKRDEAIGHYQQALALKPTYAEAYNNLGIALHAQGRLDEAVVHHRQALALKPDYAGAHNSLGTVLEEQGKLEEAMAHYRQALALEPDYAEAHHNLGLAYLLSGDLARGWIEEAWRWRSKDYLKDTLQDRRVTFPEPFWDGTDLTGQTILLRAEQGLGDTIQFIRYAPLVTRRGGRVIVECQAELCRLLKTVTGIAQITAPGEPLPKFDIQANLLDLPRIFETTLESVPAEVPYIAPPKSSHLRLSSPHASLMKVGIVWAGGLRHKRDHHRSCKLSLFRPLFAVPGIAWYGLQKGPQALELAEVRSEVPVHDLGGQLDDFADTAAVITQLDLVISVDTAVAHLAGALGRAVWVLLPFVPDWRWMLKREDSPWYPTMRLFRQDSPGDWLGVFTCMAEELMRFVEERRV